MKILADENIESEIIDVLRSAGHQVTDIKESSPGIGDRVVLAIAGEIGAVLLTHDKDFGELVYRDHLFSSGVVLLRLGDLDVAEKAGLISVALDKHGNSFSGSFTVITPTGIRIRK